MDDITCLKVIAAMTPDRAIKARPAIKQRTERYHQIVDHFERVARANVEKFAHVTDVSCIAGIRAARDVVGICARDLQRREAI